MFDYRLALLGLIAAFAAPAFAESTPTVEQPSWAFGRTEGGVRAMTIPTAPDQTLTSGVQQVDYYYRRRYYGSRYPRYYSYPRYYYSTPYYSSYYRRPYYGSYYRPYYGSRYYGSRYYRPRSGFGFSINF
jgi:hypothetical protein